MVWIAETGWRGVRVLGWILLAFDLVLWVVYVVEVRRFDRSVRRTCAAAGERERRLLPERQIARRRRRGLTP
jgi:hypothetical protein